MINQWRCSEAELDGPVGVASISTLEKPSNSVHTTTNEILRRLYEVRGLVRVMVVPFNRNIARCLVLDLSALHEDFRTCSWLPTGAVPYIVHTKHF